MSINYPSVTITPQVKKEMEARAYNEYTTAQSTITTHTRTVESAKRSLNQAEAALAAAKAAAIAKWDAYEAARKLHADTYTLVDRFGSQKPQFSSLFSNPRDYVYVAQSRSGGVSHTARIDEQSLTWRCDCKSGAIRGACWFTKAIVKGVKLDLNGNPYVVDENGNSHDVARFKRQV